MLQAQQRGGTVQTDKVQPVNSGANPYRVIRDWAHSEFWRKGHGAVPTAWPSTEMASPCGRRTDARPGQPQAASAQKRTLSTILTIPGRRSGALAAGCSCGRMASMSIDRVMCG
jgi:hypothetical protein